jgi:tRNA (adenine57-N1/adenine58-N1)-methyltransferase
MNTITLESQKVFHSHRGAIPHERIVGLPDGSVIANDSGIPHLVLRPLLSDFVMGMPRGATIIYPKDAQAILGQADIFPGARVVEAGVGSGALSLWILRAIGPTGHLFSFERRQEFADVATANGVTYFGHSPSNWTITIGDLQESLGDVVESATADRVVLDMLAPWECVESVADALIPGGVVLCYVATVTQLSRTVEAFRASDRFTNPVSSETMIRGWHVEGLAVRPEHRMTGHTGFLMTARLLAPGADLPELKRRASKSDFEDSDVEAWTPGALADRQVSDKVLRKRLRAAEDSARLSADSHEESR